MTPIERLIAEHEISKLITSFAVLNDQANWSGVAALFAEQARFVRPAGGDAIVGREAIRASFESRPPRKSCHMITNVIVDLISPREAKARSTLLLYTAPAGAESAIGPALIGGFRDLIIHGDEGWRFSERIGFLDLKVNLP
jgi:3-phenylpropionate/cinnamic acid dioxygenase small subunit